MEKQSHLTKSRYLLLFLFALIVGTGSAWADELTVYDGVGSSTYYPVHGNYADTSGSLSEFIMPASELADMNGLMITKMTFYISSVAEAKWTSTFTVYMKEIEETSYESLSAIGDGGATVVYTGQLDGTGSTMVVNFTNGFNYQGGNLLIGFKVTSATSVWKAATFAGTTQSGYTAFRNKNSAIREKFLPKTTFTYSSASGYVASPSGLAVSNVTNTSAVVSWTSDESAWNLNYKKSSDDDWTAVNGLTEKSYSLTSLSKETAYQVRVQAVKNENTSDWSSTLAFTTKPDPVTVFPFEENFNGLSSGIPTHWDNSEGTVTTDSYKWNYNASGHDGACVMFNSYNNQSGIWNALKTPAMNLPTGKTMQLNFWYKNPAGGDFSVYISKDGGETYTTSIATGLTGQSDWKEVLYTLPNEFQEQENVVIVFKGTSNYGSSGAYIYLDDVAIKEASAEPVLTVDATPIAFGVISSSSEEAAKQSIIAIQNTGAGQMTGVTISYTATSGDADIITFSPALSDATINGNATQNVSATVDTDKTGAFSGTIRVAATGLTPVEIPVSGYVLDGSKICETFASKPDRWTASSGWSYNATTGAYSTTYGGSTLTSPKIIVGNGEKLTISAKSAYSGASYYVKIEGYNTLTSSWETINQLSTVSDPAISTSDFTIVTLDGVATTVNRLRITAYYAYINALNGFTYDEDPQLALYSDEACTTTQAATATKNYGFVAGAQQQKYYIKNTGNGQIDLTIEQADGFTATVDDAALTEGEKATLTIDMAATEGLHNGTVTVTAKNHKTNDVLGTFAVTLNGAVAGSKNDIDFVGGSLSALPAGWETTGWTVTNSSYVGVSSTAYDLTSQEYTVGDGETLLIEAKTTNLSWYTPELSYCYKVGNGDWSAATEMSGFANDYKVFAITGIPEGQVRVKFTGKYIQIRRIYGFEAASVPVMVFTADGTTKNFGMITDATTSDAYTITNSGAGILNGLSITCDDDNFEIAVADNATSIAANGGTATFTVRLKNDNLGLHEGTVTIAGTGVESKTLNVKGYVADDSKIFTTFAAKPERWTNTGNYWSFSASGATATSSSSKLESPKIKITEGQKLAISAMQRYSGSNYYVTINGSSDNGATWTAYTKTLDNTQLNTTDYTVVELDDVPTTVNKLQLVGYYVYVNGLNGFTYDDNDPEFGVFSDALFASQITSGSATNAWGFVNEDKTATYYIKNTGTGTMTLSKSDDPAGFTATLGATSLGTGESTTLTIAMANNSSTNEGYHAGDVVLTAKDNADNTLGTFTVTSSGVVVGSKTDINFTTLDAFPAGWETTTWTVTKNTKATVGYSTGTLTTGTYSVAAGEKMVVLAKKNGSYGTLSYKVSTDGGSTWSAATTITPSSTSEYELKVIEGIPAGDNVKIEFTGYYADIQRIYGFTAVAKPVMTLSPADASYDFGMQTTAADYVITITNSGTANMTNLAAALSGTDTDDFDVAVSKTTVPYTGENTATITVTMKASTEYKTHNATLTISADGLADKVITLSGKTRDASKWYVDFASEIPSNFVEKGSWSVYSGTARTTASTESCLITQPINLAANEKIYFDAYNPYSGSLKVRYSVNGGISWSDYTDYSASINTSGSFSSHEIDLENDAAVTAIVEFKGRYYIQLDNIYGGTLNNTAPTIKVTKSAAIVENGTTEEFGSIKAEATATYTITNVGNGTLTITDPVSKTGAATATIDATSLANGESATLTITMPVAAPYEYKEGVVTVETNLGNFVINYNATILNPNALDEQFASGKPAGWYFDGYWEVESQTAQNTASGVADLISEQLAVAGTSDVLTFQAKKSGSSTPTFNVYTSQDRVTWTPVDLGDLTLTSNYQDVNISGLAAGDYYVKITGARIKVDNFLGWEKKNNTHDLYVTATSFPATTTKGNSATISATVTSLIAAEEGIYAKLFINGVQEGDAAAAQDIALNGTKTFSFTYAIPENKTAQIKVYYSDDTEAFATAVNAIKVSYTLSETSSEAITAGTFNVSMTRTFNVGWNTLCLPFAMSAEQMEAAFGAEAKAYEFDNFDDGVLSFQKVTALTAATPYLIYLPDDVSSTLSINDAVVSNTEAQTVTKGGIDFIGTYTPIAAPGMDGKWGVTAAGKIGKGTNTAFINGFRAYFSGSLANARIAFFDENEATGIELIQDSRFKVEDAYDLQGRKVEYLKKGQLYIKNGKKVVIK